MQKLLAFFLVLILLTSIPLSACGGGGGSSDESPEDEATSKKTPPTEDTKDAGNSEIDDPELIELLNPPKYEPPAPSSFDLIDTALEEESISDQPSMADSSA